MLKKILISSTFLILSSGCSVLDGGHHGSSNDFDLTHYDSGYGYEGMSNPTPSKKGSVDSEKPVQMTTKDNKLKELSPQLKKAPTPNSNVLLPLSAGDL